jgi:nitrogen-specific signal transduction histidine kinase
MAAGLAHEIRNPLGGIQLYTSSLAKDLKDQPQPLLLVQKISGGVKRLEALRAELSEKNRQLERKNRLAALGEMAAGLAHEIRNPLGGVQLYANLLAGDVKDKPESSRSRRRSRARAVRSAACTASRSREPR